MNAFFWALIGFLAGVVAGGFGYACLLVWVLGWGCEPDLDAGWSDSPWRKREVR